MKIEEFIQGMRDAIETLRVRFFCKFRTSPEEFDKPFAAPEIIDEADKFRNIIQIMHSRIETAENIKNGIEVSDDEINKLLEIEAGKECEDLIEIARERNLLSCPQNLN